MEFNPYLIHSYRRKPIRVKAYRTEIELDLHVENNNIIHADVGDFIISSSLSNGLSYPHKPETFLHMYTHIEGDEYVKKPLTVRAFQVEKECTINTMAGLVKAYPTDYIVINDYGELHPVVADIFPSAYELVEVVK